MKTMKKQLLITAALLASAPAAAETDAKPTKASIDPGTITVLPQNREANNKVRWRPVLFMTLRCPVAGGSNLVVEYTQGKKRLATAQSTLDNCPAGNTYRWQPGQGQAFEPPNDVDLDVTGVVVMKIRLTNELAKSDVTLYTGSFKVGKQKVDKFRTEFYIDYDARLPIGYTEVDYQDQNTPTFRWYLWFRKADLKGCLAHVSHGGKEIDAVEGFSWADFGTRAPSAYQWSILQFSSEKIHPYDRGKNRAKWPLDQHPGTYEVSVVCGDQVARYFAFTVEGGVIADAAAKANPFGPTNQLLAVAVQGDLDGKWDATAWKSGIFGNPLADFAPPKPGAAPAVAAGPLPTLVKTTMRIEALTTDGAKPTFIPQIYFTLKAPLAGGNRLSIDWLLPNKKPWLTQAMDTPRIADGSSIDLQGTGQIDAPKLSEFPRDKGQAKPGEYGFRIHLSNVLAKSDVTLMTGTFKVGYVAAHKAFFVDQDAWLPMALVSWSDNPRQKDSPELMVRIWMHHRFDDEACQVHVFHKGQEIPGTSNHNGGDSGHDKAPNTWSASWFGFDGVRGFGPRGTRGHLADQNPGEYEFKLLCDGKLARTGKFTTGDGGKILDPAGLDGKLGLGGAGVLVPVVITGDYDGKVDKKAFNRGIYGNPVTGLGAP